MATTIRCILAVHTTEKCLFSQLKVKNGLRIIKILWYTDDSNNSERLLSCKYAIPSINKVIDR